MALFIRMEAAPHAAMEHDGSSASTERKAASPSLNQNECSNATPRLSSFCTALLHEFAKLTEPSACFGLLPSSSCAETGAVKAAATAIIASDFAFIMSSPDRPAV